jgi:hypothetical protein
MPGQPPAPRYHWIVTLLWNATAGGDATTYTEGTITPQPGETRQQVFRRVRDAAVTLNRAVSLSDPVTIFFALEPDELGGS